MQSVSGTCAQQHINATCHVVNWNMSCWNGLLLLNFFITLSSNHLFGNENMMFKNSLRYSV
jgi:hypothetical protein